MERATDIMSDPFFSRRHMRELGGGAKKKDRHSGGL
jgi:hypothetical protein